jgi:Protein of unknown function (DUF1573)/Abnormal spindle-like microcephaly-assoc'd, ASPM-SPD-2-Hydin
VTLIEHRLPWSSDNQGGIVAPAIHSVHPILRSIWFAASLSLLAFLCIGCAGSQTTVPGLSVSSSSFDFQTVPVGQQVTKTFTISNTGTMPLQIAAVSVSSKQFSLAGPSVPQTIQPTSALTYTVTYSPTSAGNTNAKVDISTATVVDAARISLRGRGQGGMANLVITPNIVSFGNLQLKSKGTQNVTLQNTGAGNLALQGVTLSGAGFGYSDLSPGFSLAPNQTVTFQVWFSPQVNGPASATLTLLSPNLSSPGTLSMMGDGVSGPVSGPVPTPPVGSSKHAVDLSWGASKSEVIGYRVYRSEVSGTSYAPLNGTALNALNFIDTTVIGGTTYYYVVTAVDAAGVESPYSNQVTAAVPAT